MKSMIVMEVPVCANAVRTAMRERGKGIEAREERLLDVSQVAEILSCSERTVWRWRDEKVMPTAIAIGRVVRWSRRAIMEWIQDGCPRSGADEGRV